MASLEDLFPDTRGSRPKPPQWNNVGDFHIGVITDEPYTEPEVEVNGSWEPLYVEKNDKGEWKRKIKSNLIDGSERMELTQIVVPVRLLATGEEATFFFAGKEKKDELMRAMKESGVALVPGVAIKQELASTTAGRNKKGRTWDTKISAPKAAE
jgi:hypothetical protein